VAEFYAFFGHFLAGFQAPRTRPSPPRRPRPVRPPRRPAPRRARPRAGRGGNDIAARLRLEKGARSVAGILAWPGRYCRKLGREMPIATEGREDGGTDYYVDPGVAALFAPAREAHAPR